jgi:ubiquinone/menaquinone biosynthesis C-methylase UbiE
MSYLSLVRRVPEASAIEPRAMTWLYGLVTQMPLMRRAYRRFVAGALSLGVEQGLGLDLGTGPGTVAIEIARQRPGLRMVGLDLAAHMVAKAKLQAARAGLDGRGAWPQADGHSLPFRDDCFDLVISSFALHHWDDPLRILDEIGRVLRPGGRYYICDLCREPNLFQRFFAYGSIPFVSSLFGSYLGYGGYYESVRAGYTREEARALLADSTLPPGEIKLDSVLFMPILTISPVMVD